MIARRRVEDVVDGEGGNEVRALRLHQGKRLSGCEGAVFDRVDTGAYRVFDCFLGIDVCGHFHAERVRGLHCGAHFVVGHELLARVIARRCDAARRHHLDQVGAASPMFTDPDARLFGRVNQTSLPAGMRECGIEAVLRIAVPARGAQRLQRDPETRSWNLAVVDGVSHRDRFAAAADVARARETLLQHLAYEHGGIECPIRIGVRHPVFGGVGAARQ